MTRRIPHHLLTGALAVAIFYGLMGVEVQCTQAGAERLSLTLLAADIDALAAEVDELQCANFASVQLVGFTTTTFLGTEGPLGYSRACHTEFQNENGSQIILAHIKQYRETILTGYQFFNLF